MATPKDDHREDIPRQPRAASRALPAQEVELRLDRLPSPVGTLLIVSNGEGLCALDYVGYEQRMMELLHARYPSFSLKEVRHNAPDPLRLRRALRGYFAGDFAALDAVPVDFGGTPFQRRVWTALRAIPAGTTLTYGALAERLGQITASRAVGLANSQNPIAIVLPCHRVIAKSGALTGYAGGLDRKRWLLAHEGVTARDLFFAQQGTSLS